MTRDKKILYAVSLVLTAALPAFLLVGQDSGRYLAAVFLLLSCLLFAKAVKKRSIYSIHHKQVTLLLGAAALLAITVFYLTGIYFGYRRASVPFSPRAILTHILPITVLILSCEMLRAMMLAQKKAAVSVCAFLIGVLIEPLCSSVSLTVTSVYALMDLVGMTLFPAIVANLLYHYLSARYGPRPTVLYRLLITLYPYVIPYFPNLPDALRAFARLLLPLAVLGFVFVLYEKKPRKARKRASKWRFAWLGAALAACILFVMLISCDFRFGAIVIGSESMTGALNVGDAVIFEKYGGQQIREQDIIIFQRQNQRVIHRVVKIECINGQNRYYTKGDANEQPDTGYVTDSEIMGVTDFKIAYIGYPTVWLHRFFATRS